MPSLLSWPPTVLLIMTLLLSNLTHSLPKRMPETKHSCSYHFYIFSVNRGNVLKYYCGSHLLAVIVTSSVFIGYRETKMARLQSFPASRGLFSFCVVQENRLLPWVETHFDPFAVTTLVDTLQTTCPMICLL